MRNRLSPTLRLLACVLGAVSLIAPWLERASTQSTATDESVVDRDTAAPGDATVSSPAVWWLPPAQPVTLLPPPGSAPPPPPAPPLELAPKHDPPA